MESVNFCQLQDLDERRNWTAENARSGPASLYRPYHDVNDPVTISYSVQPRRESTGVSSWSSRSSSVSYGSPNTTYSFSDVAETRADSWDNLKLLGQSIYESPAPTLPGWEADFGPEDVSQKLSCSECTSTFANLRALDRHTQTTSHKAWSCSEVGCGKSYARRDTYLRHCSTHKGSSHPCVVCVSSGKQKFFKRKDHLREHMRSCHSSGADEIRSSNDVANDSAAPINCNTRHTSIVLENEISTPEQQQAMKVIVKSLGTVLGDRHPNLIGKLGSKVTTMSDQDMKSIAESMAVSALAKAYLNAPETNDLQL